MAELVPGWSVCCTIGSGTELRFRDLPWTQDLSTGPETHVCSLCSSRSHQFQSEPPEVGLLEPRGRRACGRWLGLASSRLTQVQIVVKSAKLRLSQDCTGKGKDESLNYFSAQLHPWHYSTPENLRWGPILPKWPENLGQINDTFKYLWMVFILI